jgi:hypothetical protein
MKMLASTYRRLGPRMSLYLLKNPNSKNEYNCSSINREIWFAETRQLIMHSVESVSFCCSMYIHVLTGSTSVVTE